MSKKSTALSRKKLLEWLDVEIELSKGTDSVLKADRWAFRQVKKAIEMDLFNIDPDEVTE